MHVFLVLHSYNNKSCTLSLIRIATFFKLPVFWRRAYTNEYGVIHDPGSQDPDPGRQEKSMKNSCVSFDTECIFHPKQSLNMQTTIHYAHVRSSTCPASTQKWQNAHISRSQHVALVVYRVSQAILIWSSVFQDVEPSLLLNNSRSFELGLRALLTFNTSCYSIVAQAMV